MSLVASKFIDRREFDIKTIVSENPPLWKHPLKQAVYDWVSQKAPLEKGALSYTRWEACELPVALGDHRCELVVEPDVYGYQESSAVSWHVNFADPHLFVAYGSGLLAQDEWQVLEHPVLGSLREALLAQGLPARTRADSISTPILIAGAPRQCAFDVFPTPDVPGREDGLYGNKFQRAHQSAVLSALTAIAPPTITNLIAIAALTGSGLYTLSQITATLETAYTGFAAAVEESQKIRPGAAVEVHTGYWGCGAFGGNRVLMALVQILAAKLARVDRLVFYTGSHAEVFPVDEARTALDRLSAVADGNTSALLEALGRKGFKWGTSDGN